MIYEEHGLTTKIALNSALKRAGIEITLQEAPLEITTDVICTVDTTKHDVDERAKVLKEVKERSICFQGEETFGKRTKVLLFTEEAYHAIFG